MCTSAQVEAGELSAATDNHLDTSIAQSDAIRQVQVLQLEEELRTGTRRPRTGIQVASVPLRTAAAASVASVAAAQRTGVDASDLCAT